MATAADSSSQSCATSPRVRKEWRQLTAAERELLVSTMELAIERNLLQTFLGYHIDQRSAFQAHATCGFALWHRRFLLAAEDVLREVDPPRTSCLTVPYWDISLDFARQQAGECFSFASCAPGLFHDMMGGVPGLFEDIADEMVNATREFGAIYSGSGVLVNGRPMANYEDDLGRLGIVRHDLFQVPIPSSADREEMARLILENPAFDPFTHKLQESIHDDGHQSIGGFMPSFASPADVFFWVWHSTIDMFYNLWQECHYPEPILVTQEIMGTAHCDVRPLWSDEEFQLGGPPPLDYPAGVSLQPSSTEEMIIGKAISATARLDVWDDPLIGGYFQDVRHFWEVADSRLMLADRSFTIDLVRHDLALWNTNALKNLCTFHRDDDNNDDQNDDGTVQLTTLSTATNDGETDLSYPYSDLERLIKDSTVELFPPNDPQREDPDVQSKRLQYVSCAILHTRGSIVSDSNTWEKLRMDVTERTPEVPEGGPDRCSFLWPGAWIPPSVTIPDTPDDDGLEASPLPSSHDDSFPSVDQTTSSLDDVSSGGLRHGVFTVVIMIIVLRLLMIR